MKTRLGALLISFCLLGTFFLPSIHQWMHLVDNHDKERICSQTSTHFHETELSCSLTFTFTTPFTLAFHAPTSLFSYMAKAIKTEKHTNQYVSTEIDQTNLRGPPYLLFNL